MDMQIKINMLILVWLYKMIDRWMDGYIDRENVLNI